MIPMLEHFMTSKVHATDPEAQFWIHHDLWLSSYGLVRKALADLFGSDAITIQSANHRETWISIVVKGPMLVAQT